MRKIGKYNYLGKVVGTAVSPQLLNYISLFALKFKLSNSGVLKIALKEWFKNSLKRYPKEVLIRDIINTYQEQWETIKMKNKTMKLETCFEKFKERLNYDLLQKHVDTKDKVKIINGIIFERT